MSISSSAQTGSDTWSVHVDDSPEIGPVFPTEDNAPILGPNAEIRSSRVMQIATRTETDGLRLGFGI